MEGGRIRVERFTSPIPEHAPVMRTTLPRTSSYATQERRNLHVFMKVSTGNENSKANVADHAGT